MVQLQHKNTRTSNETYTIFFIQWDTLGTRSCLDLFCRSIMDSWSNTTKWSPSFQLLYTSASGGYDPALLTEPGRYNFLSFLAVVQELEIEFLPLSWDNDQDVIGIGGTGRIQQSAMNIDTSFAFKTYRKQNMTNEQVFRILINEITIHRIVSYH